MRSGCCVCCVVCVLVQGWLSFVTVLITIRLDRIRNAMSLFAAALADPASATLAPSQDIAAPYLHGATIASEMLAKRRKLADFFWEHAERTVENDQKLAEKLQQIKADIENRLLAGTLKIAMIGEIETNIGRGKVDTNQQEVDTKPKKLSAYAITEIEHQKRMDADWDIAWDTLKARWAKHGTHLKLAGQMND